jgi:hypothetical protein
VMIVLVSVFDWLGGGEGAIDMHFEPPQLRKHALTVARPAR